MSNAAGLHLVRTPDRPGPGPIPDGVLRALDLTIQRRVAGDAPDAVGSEQQPHSRMPPALVVCC